MGPPTCCVGGRALSLATLITQPATSCRPPGLVNRCSHPSPQQVCLPENCSLLELLAVLSTKKQHVSAAGLHWPLLSSPRAPVGGAGGAGGGPAPPGAPAASVSIPSAYWSPALGSSVSPSTQGNGPGPGPGAAGGGGAAGAFFPAASQALSSVAGTVRTSVLGGAAASVASAAGNTLSGLHKVVGGVGWRPGPGVLLVGCLLRGVSACCERSATRRSLPAVTTPTHPPPPLPPSTALCAPLPTALGALPARGPA